MRECHICCSSSQVAHPGNCDGPSEETMVCNDGKCPGELAKYKFLSTAVSSEAWAKLRDWASVAGRGLLLLSGSIAHASLKSAVREKRSVRYFERT